MAVEGGNKIIKYLMFFFNFIFFLCGAVIIVAGALVLTKYSEYVDFTGSAGNAIPIVLIIVGVGVLLTGFLGCCGAIRENYCMVALFSIILVVILLFELGGGIAAYVLRGKVSDIIEDNMNELMPFYLNTSATTKLFDGLQHDLQCCGTTNYTNWFAIYNTNQVPESCCLPEHSNCTKNPTIDNVFIKGCFYKLTDLLKDNIIIVGAIAIVVGLIQIFGVVCACCLMRSIKSEYEVV